ncbi:hypothetical protein LC087_19370 (plasmid) [Bacillus carboniphilus]|uniref:DUF4288 domain-containing protein n=1 Tax=Bacillus carboniphilus TaxID=86663 RepID=A0ABY9K1I3_9BACI|nr:hypothetical protein [Bacillus carboniphilus]WLR44463.1 hypothetical protein LC087_19370 [Bacillus carboniphilus]
MRYFEFNKQEYYALIAVEDCENAKEKAFEVYAEQVAGNSIEEVKLEGEPKQLDKFHALCRYIVDVKDEDDNNKISELIDEFTSATKTTLLLIDRDLVRYLGAN